MTGDWKVVEEEMPTPFLVSADFDGNGVDDEISIVVGTNGAGWRLIALMNGNDVPMTLVSSAYGTAQTFGIEEVQSGVYKTACGKGYWECASGEPETLRFDQPAFRFFELESASTLFYWDKSKRRFKEVAESD